MKVGDLVVFTDSEGEKYFGLIAKDGTYDIDAWVTVLWADGIVSVQCPDELEVIDESR